MIRTLTPSSQARDRTCACDAMIAGHGSTRRQPVEAGTTIDRRKPERGAGGGSRAQPPPEAVLLQAGEVLGLLPRAEIWVVVGCHFTILSVWGLEAPNPAWSPKPYRRLPRRAAAQGRSRQFPGVPAAPVSALQIPRVLVDGNARPRWAPGQTDARLCIAPFPPIADLRGRRPPPSPAEGRRARRTGRRGPARQRFVATEHSSSDPFKKAGIPTAAGARSITARRLLTAFGASRKLDHERFGFIPRIADGIPSASACFWECLAK